MHRLSVLDHSVSKDRGVKKPPSLSLSALEAPPHQPLQASVLVLNRLYLAVRIVSVRRAMGLLCRELAEVIDHDQGAFANYGLDAWRAVCRLRCEDRRPYDDWLRSVNFEILIPRVIRLFSYDRIPRQQLRLSRRAVLARDEHTCQYCGRHLSGAQLSLDHVIPRSRGGQTTWENVVCACLSCNVRKGGRTPREANMKLHAVPAKPHRNPLLAMKLGNPRYSSWSTWLEGVCWDIGARD